MLSPIARRVESGAERLDDSNGGPHSLRSHVQFLKPSLDDDDDRCASHSFETEMPNRC